MKSEEFIIQNRECFAFFEEDPACVIVQPVDKREVEDLWHEAETVFAGAGCPLLLCFFCVESWNGDLSPWDAPPVFGKEGFGHGAGETLRFITEDLLPYVTDRYGGDVPAVLGGYSLAGLFALWSAYQTDAFKAVAAVSPSVWFPGWMEYAADNEVKAGGVYLSLGDKEERTKNKITAAVGDCIRRQYGLLQEADVRCILEWNEGNHFRDPSGRCAKGLLWCVDLI